MTKTKIFSIVAAIATVGSALLLALTGHISWAEATPIVAAGLSVVGIHADIPPVI